MDVVAFLVLVALFGLVIGALARLAVPGPDPMSIWQTILLGVAGAFTGGLISRALGVAGGGGLLFAVMGGVLLLIAYRRLVQRRGITGPTARRLRESDDPIDQLKELRTLRDRGEIDGAEYERRKAELTARI